MKQAQAKSTGNHAQDEDDDDGEYFIDADLEEFVIYRPHRANAGNRQKRLEEAPLANEIVSLNEINEWGVRYLLFDGIISFGNEKRYVQRVPFETLSIGGYGEFAVPTERPDIWIQSFAGKGHEVWYRLKLPAEEYRRYHKSFLWMAGLAKHVVDYLSSFPKITLDHFRAQFHTWMTDLYGSDDFHCQWLKVHGKQDFRQIVVSQANFLWCQASQIDHELETQPLWTEIHPKFLNAVSQSLEQGLRPEMLADSKELGQTVSRRKTTVTPYVYEHFKHLPCAKFLYCQSPSVDLWACQAAQSIPQIIRFTSAGSEISDGEPNAKIGDVVSLPIDSMTTWQSNDTCWLGYVQNVTNTDQGLKLDLLWLYRPSDTQCLKVAYPHTKELFLSDHCNCGDIPIFSREVIHRPRVAFFGEPNTKGVDYFVRQAYIEGDGAWQTLGESHFKCNCLKEEDEPNYSCGDTLLVKIKKILEPVIFIGEEAESKVKVKRLLRRRRDFDDARAAPNELVLTDDVQIIPQKSIVRGCQIRFFTETDKAQRQIPTPYDRDGVGDFYYIIARDPNTAQSPLTEGWDPTASSGKTMRGLDLFCGGGNFGRGLEEGGAVCFQHVVDWDNAAIHTYKANLHNGDGVHLFRGSVNEYLTQAMQGKGADVFAHFGQVEVIVAGSPCQGFSHANPFKGNDRSLINVSMIASVVAYVDFYRPKYAIMENVKGMAGGPDTENVLALVISALVGLGYQVRTFALDAWSYSSPQSRTRVLISIAAPGLNPIPEPPHTHAHPENVVSASLGKLASGLRSTSRFSCPTPFQYVTAASATEDLPVTDGRISCIRFPDHRMSRTLSTLSRNQIGSVPRFPGGSTFVSAVKAGYMPQAQIDAFSWNNECRSGANAKSWARVKRDRLMPTVMTEPRPEDGVSGVCLHWDQERLLTIMEVRRGQGFPDNEVLVGLPRDQWKIVGNSVARPVALALGLSLRSAWLANQSILEQVVSEETVISTRPSAKAVSPPRVDDKHQTTDTMEDAVDGYHVTESNDAGLKQRPAVHAKSQMSINAETVSETNSKMLDPGTLIDVFKSGGNAHLKDPQITVSKITVTTTMTTTVRG